VRFVTDMPRTIPAVLERRATSPNGFTFLDSSGVLESWTFGDLARIARRCAGAWIELGVRPGDRVGVLGSTSPDLVAAIFGCWAAGAVAVPLAVPLRLTDPDALVEEIRSRLRKARADVLAFDPRFEMFPDLMTLTGRTVSLDALRASGRDAPFASPAPDDVALIQFTSGSTARPKGVMLSHRALIENGLASQEHVRITSADVAVSWLPLYHDFGLIGLTLWPVVFDIPSFLMGPETFLASPRRWLEAISTYRGTITAAPNFAYGLAARALRATDADLDLSSLRVAANGAEPVDPDTMREFETAAARHGLHTGVCLPVYGLAEATLGVSSPEPGSPPPPRWVDAAALAGRGVAVDAEPGAPGARPLVSVGFPIPGVLVEIRGPSGDRLPDGHVGEVVVRSEHAMLGYWQDPDETARTVRDGWIHTGDLGVWGPDGLVITGRLKDMIIVGGRNLYPEDAERVAANVDGVRRGNAVAFGVVRKAREGLVLIAETRLVGEEAVRLARQVASEVRKAMGVAMEHVVLLAPGSLPKTPSGKLQRTLTRMRYEAGQLVTHAVATAGRALGRPTPA
jgi:acyl-CoA synthetase (AMP-forming)/AMP-acid ligase II